MRRMPSLIAILLLCLVLGAAWRPDAIGLLDGHLSSDAVLAMFQSGFVTALDMLPKGGASRDPFAAIMLELTLLIGMVVAAHWLAARLRQPAVLGELTIGVLLGNLGYWLGLPFFSFVMDYGAATPLLDRIWESGASLMDAAAAIYGPDQLGPGGNGHEVVQLLTGQAALRNVNFAESLWLFSSLGIVLLLFKIGLETGVDQLREVGIGAARVALIGAVGTLLLGVPAVWLLMGDAPLTSRLFVAASLSATSIGIASRMLEDIGQENSAEGRMVLGACVLNDVIGLVLLAICISLVLDGQLSVGGTLWLLLLSGGFLAVVIFFGDRLGGPLARQLEAMREPETRFLVPLALAFLLGWVCSGFGLSGTIGGFAAGLILSDDALRQEAKTMLQPLIAVFTPIFFLLIGMQVNLGAFLHPDTIILTVALLAVAVLGKLPAALVAGPGVDRLSVAIGLLPRGEVALIFVGVGKSLGVIDADVFAALITVIIVLAFGTGLALKWSFAPVSGPAKAALARSFRNAEHRLRSLGPRRGGGNRL